MPDGPLRDVAALARHAVRLVIGESVGSFTALVALGYLAGCGVLMVLTQPWRRLRRAARLRVLAGARRLAELDRRRVVAMTSLSADPSAATLTGPRAVGYLAIRWPVGLLGGAVLIVLLYGVVNAGALLWGWVSGRHLDGLPPTAPVIGYLVLGGLVMMFLVGQGVVGVASLEQRLVRWLVEPDHRVQFQRRIAELTASRSDVVEAVNDERRRIERDLHDGVQQRLVALGMLLGRARRSGDPAQAAALLRQAHEESGRALDELREVAWRIYPTALDSGGLAVALDTIAERSSVPVRLGPVPGDLDAATETVAYFVVCEAVTNAAKYSGADRIDIDVAREADRTVVRVRDNGAGGADPRGGGLSGLARRVAALDGRLSVDSPSGGPTTITAELPCA